MLTYFIYIGSLALGCKLSEQAERKNNICYLAWLWLLMTFVTGLRGIKVGMDTPAYYHMFHLIGKGQARYAYGLEPGFKFFCGIILRIFNSPIFLMVVICGLTYFFLLIRIWDFRKSASLPCMFFCYYTQFFFFTLNGIRQSLAVVMVFFATRYLMKGKYLKYIIWVIIAGTFFHKSALACMVLCCLGVFQWRNLKRRKKIFFLAVLMICPYLIHIALPKMANYAGYLTQGVLNLGIMIPAKVMLFFFVIFSNNNFEMKFHISREKKKNNIALEKSSNKIVALCYFGGLLLTGLAYVIRYAGRAAMYFYIFEIVFWGMYIKGSTYKSKYRKLFLCGYFMLQGYNFAMAMLFGSQGAMPYRFIWQDLIFLS